MGECMKAIWNEQVIAESDQTVIVENNHYFPVSSVKQEHLRASDKTTQCFWKGTANYYDIVVGDAINAGAAWYYANPKDKAKNIKGYIAFWRGVQVLAE